MSHSLKKDHAIAGIVLGIMEIVFGLIVTICSFVLAGKATMSASSTPYWAGLIFLVPGILGIVSGFTRKRGAMIAFMVLNIIAVVIEAIGFILVLIIIALWAAYASVVSTCTTSDTGCWCTVNEKREAVSGVKDCDVLTSISALLYTIIVFLILAILTALASSILGCIAVCCTKKHQPTTVIIQQPGMVMQDPVHPPHYDYK